MNNRDKIIKYIEKRGQATANELTEYLGISRQALFKHHLSKLLEEGVITKVGKPPKVFYSMSETEEKQKTREIVSEEIKNKIDKKYLIITPSGKRKIGFEGFVYWCEKNNLPINKTANEYLNTLKKYEAYKQNDIIDGMQKMKSTFKTVNLDKLYYLDFYSIERFGKTKLGQLLLYAKQSQNRTMMKELIVQIKPRIEDLIRKYNIDSIGFVPPTVKREVQIMKILEKGLGEKKPKLKITKIKTPVAVPQKTLNKLGDRVENARETFIIEENSVFSNILLIDDAIGSGATMNEISGKIKSKGICRGKIIGVAITGSFKGFDVISEV